jgi:hypothetical protein
MSRPPWVTACLLAAVAGCAAPRAERLQAQLDELRYARPLDEVWLGARRLLADQGYPLAGEDAKAVGQPEMASGDRILSPAKATHPYGEEVGLLQRLGVVGGKAGDSRIGRSLDTGWRRTRDRYHLDGFEDGRGCRVVFTRVVEDPTEHREQRSRDLDMELTLARRLDPEAAARMADAAQPGPRPGAP